MPQSIYASLFPRLATPEQRERLHSRREAIRMAVGASAALMLSTRLSLARSPHAPRSGKRVVIVGAGFGGLACGYELKAAGYDVTVLEARPRLGGRVLSFGDWVPGLNVEGGGELIGTNHPTWMAYAERFKLGLLEIVENDKLAFPFVIDGKPLSEEDANKLFEELDAAHARFHDDAKGLNEDQPWLAEKAAEWDAGSTEAFIRSLGLSDNCRRALTAELEANNGSPAASQSYLGNLAQIKGGGLEAYWTDTENRRCDGGNQQLAKVLAESIGPDRIKLGTPVSSIRIGEAACSVITAAGDTHECDEVVLAVPPSVWSRISIDPALPADLAPQMGVNVKYLARVRKRFWLDHNQAATASSDGPAQFTWEATDGQTVTDETGAVLTAFSGAGGAAACRATPPDKRDEFYRTQLSKPYPDFGEQFKEARFMDWPAEEWTKASYSFPAPGQVTKMGKTLRDGIGRLHFAGEHACYKFVGYMEGALNSGVSLAARMAAADGIK